ncbi:hypothetical protein GCM10010269_52160 [Streptomyces humidus]|uniref:Uncharacterized protein n=1 Tax=Streptomyces humidus TaxID=52259 RepID=A0A918G0Y1_9ACTN|nr:hypothetical protein GCM10010269_52160 [Streptomyces humidus]
MPVTRFNTGGARRIPRPARPRSEREIPVAEATAPSVKVLRRYLAGVERRLSGALRGGARA